MARQVLKELGGVGVSASSSVYAVNRRSRSRGLQLRQQLVVPLPGLVEVGRDLPALLTLKLCLLRCGLRIGGQQYSSGREHGERDRDSRVMPGRHLSNQAELVEPEDALRDIGTETFSGLEKLLESALRQHYGGAETLVLKPNKPTDLISHGTFAVDLR